MSLPIRGAWIEIKFVKTLQADTDCRSPSGERGLKSDSIPEGIARDAVAPHPGSVD